MTGSAQLYERGTSYIVVPMARTEAGFRVSVEPTERISASAEDGVLGAAVRVAVERPQQVVPTPPPRGSAGPSIAARGAGCRSDAEFMRGARLLSVYVKGSQVLLTPSVKQGSRGFGLLSDDATRFDYVDDEHLGAALREALQRSK